MELWGDQISCKYCVFVIINIIIIVVVVVVVIIIIFIIIIIIIIIITTTCPHENHKNANKLIGQTLPSKLLGLIVHCLYACICICMYSLLNLSQDLKKLCVLAPFKFNLQCRI